MGLGVWNSCSRLVFLGCLGEECFTPFSPWYWLLHCPGGFLLFLVGRVLQGDHLVIMTIIIMANIF